MAKAGFWLNGAKGTLAGSVIAKSPQGTVIREKAKPSNPRTEAQVQQRAKMKLASQLSAVMAPVIAIPRQKGLTARNIFVSKNIQNVIAENGEVSATLPNIQLTNSNIGLPGVVATKTSADSDFATVKLSGNETLKDLSRVVYTVFLKNSEGSLTLVDSKIVDAGSSYDFASEIYTPSSGDCVIYAYGARDVNTKATATYKNYKVQNAVDFASLIFSRKISTTDMNLTSTRGTQLLQGASASLEVPNGYFGIYLSVRPADTGSWVAYKLDLAEDGSFTEGEEIELKNGMAVVKSGTSVGVTFVPNAGYERVGVYDLTQDTERSYKQSTFQFAERKSTIDMVAVTKARPCSLGVNMFTTDMPEEPSDLYTRVTDFKDLWKYMGGADVQWGSQIPLTAPTGFTYDGKTYVFRGWLDTVVPPGVKPETYWSTSESIMVRCNKQENGFSCWYEELNPQPLSPKIEEID